MPGVNGPELHARVSAVRPGAKVLFVSGDTENVIVRRGVLKEDVGFVQKPFTVDALDSKIREALAR